MIRADVIQTILDTSRIEEVIGDFVTLKKRGVNYIGLCPFHNEKTPSFTVSAAKGIYKCFGCGKAGNAVNFVMEHEHCSYPEALKYIAGKYHIDVEEVTPNEEQIKLLNERESLLELTAFAQKYYSKTLFETEEGKSVGLLYLKDRGFFIETIKKFQIGYSLDSWDDFAKTALNKGFKKEFLLKTGLCIEKPNGLFDRFKGRIIFPIHNLTGRVIGFTARILNSAANMAKYVNSPESEIYNKSKALYGIYFARNNIASKDLCYLTEGNVDVVTLTQSGIENVVASSGTSLTIEQVRLIRRFTKNITILYDGDAAGIKAALRGTDIILKEGMNVRIVLFPDGEDPDSYARKNSDTKLAEFINANSVDFISFKTKLLLKETNNDPIKKAGLIKEIVETVSLIPDSISRSLYIKECSSIMSVPEQTLINELNKLLKKNIFKKTPEIAQEDVDIDILTDPEPQLLIDPFDSYSQEFYLIQLLLNYGGYEINMKETDEDGREKEASVNVAEFIVNDVISDDIYFTDESFKKIFDEYVKLLKNDIHPDEKHFINHEDEDISLTAIDLMTSRYALSSNWELKYRIYVPTREDEDKGVLSRDIIASILAIKLIRIDKMLNDILEEIKQIGESDKIEEITILQHKYKKLKDVNMIISSKLGRVVNRY